MKVKDILVCLSKKTHCSHRVDDIRNKGRLFSHFRFFLRCSVFSLLIILCVFGLCVQYANKVQGHIAENVVRLHVLSNSDTYADQRLKYKVRDAVVNYLSDKFTGTESLEQTKSIIQSELDNIRAVARIEVISEGYDYEVDASVGNFVFPTKQYENIKFPAGRYDALKIVIGGGEGENWWCVLYPSLCVNASGLRMSDEELEKLKIALSKEEYKLILSGNYDDNLPKLKFRIVEIFSQK